jgi:hypothetical protein
MDSGKYNPSFLEYLAKLVRKFQESLEEFQPDDNGAPIADLGKTYNASRHNSRQEWADNAVSEMFNLEVMQSDYLGFWDGSQTLEEIASRQHCKDELLVGGYSHPQLAEALSDCISDCVRNVRPNSAYKIDSKRFNELIESLLAEAKNIHMGDNLPTPATFSGNSKTFLENIQELKYLYLEQLCSDFNDFLSGKQSLEEISDPDYILQRILPEHPGWLLKTKTNANALSIAMARIYPSYCEKSGANGQTSPSEMQNPNIFLIERSFARIRFNNRDLEPIKLLKGIEYLGYFIQHQGQIFEEPLELYNALRGINPSQEISSKEVTKSSANFLGFQISGRQKIDHNYPEHLKKIGEELRQLKELQCEAEEFRDTEEYDKLETKIKTLTKEIKAFKSKRKHKTAWDTPNKYAKNAIWNALRYAIEAINKAPNGAELANHFNQSFKPFEFPFSYDPYPSPNWNGDSISR